MSDTVFYIVGPISSVIIGLLLGWWLSPHIGPPDDGSGALEAWAKEKRKP